MTLFERLKSTDNKVKRCIAFLLFLMILLTSTIIPVKRAKAIAPVLVGVGIVALVTAGLVACGIAVNADDDGTDASTALGYTMQYVRQKMREAKVTELEAGLMVATGAINLAGQAWQWIKQAAANIYNNASYFQGSANAFQIGNLNTYGNCRYLSGDFYFYLNGSYLFSSALGIDVSKFKGKNYLYHVSGSNLAFLYGYFSSYSAQFCFASPDLSVEYYSASKGCWTSLTYNNYSFGSSSYDGHSVSYYYFGSASRSLWGDLSFSSSNDITMDSDKSFTAFLGVSPLADFATLPRSIGSICQSYYNLTSSGTGISAQTSQSASVAFDGAKDYFNGVNSSVVGGTGGSVSADLSTDQQRRLMLGYDVESSKDLINVGQIVQEYGSVSNWLAGIRAGTANAYQDLINIGCQPYVNVDAQGKLVTVDKDGYIIDSTGTRVGTGTGIKVGDGSIAGNPAIPVGDVVSVPLDDVGSIPKVKTDTATGDITVDIDKTLDIPASDTIDKPTSEAGNKKYQFAGVTDFFPFCLPFDAYDFLSTFSASPVAPEFEFPASFYTDIFGGKNPEGKHYQVNGKNLVSINGDKVIISLAPFDTIAKIFRVLVLLFFIMMLIWFAYRLIHGGD